jgi:hypothetical protein
MSKRLEQFVQDNRDDFDAFEPGPVVWHNIQQQLQKNRGKKGILISMNLLRWSAAAAVVLVLGAGAWYFTVSKKTDTIAESGGHGKVQPETTGKTQAAVPEIAAKETHATVNIQTPEPATAANGSATAAGNDNGEYNEELYHYTRLVELKQNQIKRVTKDEPLLYKKFADDINKLDSSFHSLKQELPVNPNHEQILEAMIRNLQLQEALLNQQLNIIKKISNTKKAAYEKAYKSV